MPTKYTPWRALAVTAAMTLGAGSAQASLVLLSPEDFSGTGLGAVNTVLTLQSPANSEFESGGVSFGDVITGDALSGASQTRTRTLGELGLTSSTDLRVVFNALEPGNLLNGITLQDLVLNIYATDGALLFTSGAFAPVDFADTFTGAGNAGFVFGLDAAQQLLAAPAFANAANVIGLSATAGCGPNAAPGCLGATGGFETFFVAATESNGGGPGGGGTVAEPATLALAGMALASMGFFSRRRRDKA